MRGCSRAPTTGSCVGGVSQLAACCSFSAASAHLEVLVDDGDGQQDAGAGANGALQTNFKTLLNPNQRS